MTDSTVENSAESTLDDNINPLTNLAAVSAPWRHRVHAWINRRFGRKPAYLITKHGIETHWFDFSDTGNLPFDRDTYRDTQLFIGNWANPWYVDIESIKDAYPDFTEQNITTIENVFTDKHVYPSQRWKLLANQSVLRDMFVGGGFDEQRIMRLLYALCAGVGFIAILLLFGGF